MRPRPARSVSGHARRRAPLALAHALGLVLACAPRPAPAPLADATPTPALEFVGSARCAACHAREHAAWHRSHHALAMLPATPENVRAAFDGRSLRHFDSLTRVLRRGERFSVTTEGPAGRRVDFPVAYTFGIAPLQQYLVELPGGRLQALPWAWDTRPARQGGQRFFHLYPGERLEPGDPLHWSGALQNWNFMCAECHSTGVDKGYDAARDSYATTWRELNVACEACHGPGSRHVAWVATRPSDATRGLTVDLRDRRRARHVPDPERASGTRTLGAGGPSDPPFAARPAVELDACARCHARRAPLRGAAVWGRPLLDTHRPALLDEGLYFADGQIEGEVYEYGSFLQSRMHSAGVTCSDCHEPHSGELRATDDALCTRCHAPERVATRAHHRHARAPACVDCHMPERVYMRIDRRRDHSLRVPRPDLSLSLGTPSACDGCHQARGARWAAGAARRLWGPARTQVPHYGAALQAGRQATPEAAARLATLAGDPTAPAIVRATALALLGAQDAAETTFAAVRAARHDPDGLVRLGAAAALEGLPPNARLELGTGLLSDPLLGVRVEAARVLAPALPSLPEAQRDAFARALDEYRAAQTVDADRPEAHMNLGLLAAQMGDLAAAEREYRQALRLQPDFVPAAVNLADVLRLSGRDAAGEVVLREALARAPRAAALHHALGLRLLRAGRSGPALAALARATRLAPEVARYAEVYAVARQELRARR